MAPDIQLRPHQKEAVAAATTTLRDYARASVIAACGTGKTLIAARTIARIAPRGRVLVLLPTLDLLSQTIRSWGLASRKGTAIAVCSQRQALDHEPLGADVPLTTDPAELAALLGQSSPGPVTVYATYASLSAVIAAHRDHRLPTWDLVVVDFAIYGWRGARDVMTGFDGTHLALSRSFRFGPALAHEANRWLTAAGTPLRLSGTDTIPTTLDTVGTPNAVLCRTNVGAMTEILSLLGAGHRTALVGGGAPLRALALAARDLKDGRRTTHPELVLFPTWGVVQDYAAHDPSGGDLQPLVDLIDRHGTEDILDAVGHLHDETSAQVTVSTAHKAKGREWPNVKIADDFHPPKDTDSRDENGNPVPGPIDTAEARLAYVAITRARHHLNRGSLAWIDHHPDTPPPRAQPADQQPALQG